MKNVIYVLIVLLLIWNLFLSIEINDLKNVSNPSTNNVTVVNNEVNGYITDITEVVDQSDKKVVSVYIYDPDGNFSIASGFIYQVSNNQVKVVTNYHAVQKASKIMVKFNSGEEVLSNVIGYDEYYDLAVLDLKVDFQVEPFKLGDSSILKKGEFVVAIGSPIAKEFEGSVTVGVVSGLDRKLKIESNLNPVKDFYISGIQTDASITSGNSGGPLINMAGEVIGINFSSVYGGLNSLYFAIDINEVKSILEKLANGEEVYHPIVDFDALNINNLVNYQKSFYNIELSLDSGFYITDIEEESIFYESGLREGDVVMTINGSVIIDFADFKNQIFSLDRGDSLIMEINRDGSVNEFKVVLE